MQQASLKWHPKRVNGNQIIETIINFGTGVTGSK